MKESCYGDERMNVQELCKVDNAIREQDML